MNISIHAPRVGCDLFGAEVNSQTFGFQSTHPVWGATWPPASRVRHPAISIHAPRVGCDHGRPRWASLFYHFNPRTPCGVRRSLESVLKGE